MTRPLVLDASVLLAVLLGEPGAERAEGRLPGSALSVVNLAEVLSQLVRRGVDPVPLMSMVGGLDVELVAADATRAFHAAHIHASTRKHGLSLADCFCLGLAVERGAEVLTADRGWKSLAVGVPVTLLR